MFEAVSATVAMPSCVERFLYSNVHSVGAWVSMTDVVESSTSPDSRGAIGTGDLQGERSPEAAASAAEMIQSLRGALAARDSFIALVGHELRNSIAPMVLLAEQFAVLAEDPQATPALGTRVAMLTRNLNKLVATVNRVAEAADLRRGKLRLEPTEVDFVEVVEEVCLETRREVAAAGAAIAIESSGPVTGLWDRGRLKQIVANLVSNAIRHGGPGAIEIAVRARDDSAELVVRDHGAGLAPAAIPTLFDAFESDRRVRASGFGIGLWFVKTLCTAMLGSVTAANHASGGAIFCVVLPRGSITHG